MNLSKIQQECTNRHITRLCHFTQSRNLAHILVDYTGILSRRKLEEKNFPHNPTDTERWDGRDDLVCCSIEYPNVYYLDKARRGDSLFKDWVVLFIEPKFLWESGTMFCPCNAATARGAYIGEDYPSFLSLFALQSSGKTMINRLPTHLECSPTDIQSEVLVQDPIPISSIMGIVAQNKEQAQCEIYRFKLQQIPCEIPVYVVPPFSRKMCYHK